ncbi:tetratricopeptide repeat protein [Candidatus Riflebacteria bacterium]
MRSLLFRILISISPFLLCSITAAELFANSLKASIVQEKKGDYRLAIVLLLRAKKDLKPQLFLKRLGWLHYLKKDYAKAGKIYRMALSRYPSDTEAAMGLVLVYRANNESDNAKSLCEWVLKKYPDHYLSNSHLAQIYYAEKDYRRSQKYCRRFPFDPELQSISGWSFFQLGQHEMAEKSFLQAVKYNPSHPSANRGLFALGKIKKPQYIEELERNPGKLSIMTKLIAIYLAEGSYKDALKWQIAKLERSTPDIQQTKKLAWLYFQTGQYKNCISTYKWAIYLGDGLDSSIGLLKAFSALKDYTRLKKVASFILKKSPGNYYANYYLGLMHFQLKEYAKALAIYRLFPLDAYSLEKLGLISEILGKYREAEHYLKKAVALVPGLIQASIALNRLKLQKAPALIKKFKRDPANIKPLIRAISVFLQNKRYDLVIKGCKTGLKSHPHNLYLTRTLAYHLYLKGDFPEALRQYEKILAAKPGNYHALRGRINCFLALKKYKDAKAPAKKLQQAFPKNRELRKLLSFILFSGGFYRKQEKLARAFPKDLDLNRTLGWTYYYQGKYFKSRQQFQEILQKNPDDKGAKAGLRLAEQRGQLKEGLFYTRIDYGDFQDDKEVLTFITTFYPHRWWSFRGIFNRTESIHSRYHEDAIDLGLTHAFSNNADFSLDYMWLENNDYLTNMGEVLALQLGYRWSNKLKGTLELDFSDFSQVFVSQFSPRLDWYPGNRWWLQSKGYFFNESGSQSPGGGERAFQQSVTFFYNARGSLKGLFWLGEKRLSFESDDLFTTNTFDKYTGGYGFKLAYKARKSFDYSLGYKNQNAVSYFYPGQNYIVQQITAGARFRY